MDIGLAGDEENFLHLLKGHDADALSGLRTQHPQSFSALLLRSTLPACSFAPVVIDCFQTDVEHVQLSRTGRLDAVLVQERQDAVTDFREFRLDIRGVLPRVLLLVLRLLLLHTNDGARAVRVFAPR